MSGGIGSARWPLGNDGNTQYRAGETHEQKASQSSGARVSVPAATIEGPPPELVFRRLVRPWAMLRELWSARELVVALTERDLRARYKQTKLGFAWSVLTPILLMVVFTLFFQRAANVQTNGVPYPLFTYVALLPWTFFSDSVAKGAQSITSNLSLVNKVYCPREVFPLSAVATAAFDTIIATCVLGMLFVGFTFMPAGGIVWLPVLLAIQIAFTVGASLMLAAIVVYFRDLRQVTPMALQVALFATPVMYGLEVIPAGWRPIYSVLNPLGPVIDSYRQTVLYGDAPPGGLLALAAVSAVVWLVGGFLVFKRLETGFADVA
jgi:ABC-type polysaccharide/polyol phosphate export permease